MADQQYAYREITNRVQISLTCLKCNELMVAFHNREFLTGNEMKCPKCGYILHMEVNTNVSI